jgi:hypothetical protein
MKDRRLLWLLSVLILSCTPMPVSPPLPTIVRTVAVLPPINRTGDPLLVSGASLLEKYVFRTQAVTVGEVLVAEVRMQLAHRGIIVVPAEKVEAAIGAQTPNSPKEAADLAARSQLEGDVLYIEIKQWQLPSEEAFHPRVVLVSLEASMIAVATGRIVWTAHLPLRPIPTSGAVTRADAYMIAARQVAKEVFAP